MDSCVSVRSCFCIQQMADARSHKTSAVNHTRRLSQWKCKLPIMIKKVKSRLSQNRIQNSSLFTQLQGVNEWNRINHETTRSFIIAKLAMLRCSIVLREYSHRRSNSRNHKIIFTWGSLVLHIHTHLYYIYTPICITYIHSSVLHIHTH